MKTRVITEDEVNLLSAKQEGHFFDRKALAISGKKIQKITVAYANADGGEVLIGLADDKEEPDPSKRWHGANKPEDFNSHLQALFEVKPSLDVRYELLSCAHRAGLVLRVQVEKSSQVHNTADGTVYQRLGAQSLPINDPQKIMELSFAKGFTSFEDQLLPSLPCDEIADSGALKQFLSGFSPRTDPLEYLTNEHLLDPKTWQPKAAAALLFHPSPSAVMPRKCAVKIARYSTREDDPERDHLKEQFTIEGNLYQLIHATVNRITATMSSINIWTTKGLKTVEYPPETVWEVVVNAIIHRDYSISDDVQILIYDNRIEVLSPGRLPGYVTTENILDARYSRNHKIVRCPAITSTVRGLCRRTRFTWEMDGHEGSAPSTPVWKTGVCLSTLMPEEMESRAGIAPASAALQAAA